jgi:hypothetical protein
MSTRKKPPVSKSPVKRSTERTANRKAAKIVDELKKFVPAFKKYGRARTFTDGERRFIHRMDKMLPYRNELVPIPERKMKQYENQLYKPRGKYDPESGEYRELRNAPRISAIPIRMRGAEIEIRFSKRDMFLRTNNRDYIYWQLDDVSVRSLKRRGIEAFKEFRNSFPAERLAALAERAYQIAKVKAVYLWGSHGRCAAGFASLNKFLEWLFDKYAHYQETDEWVNGLVLMLEYKAGEWLVQRKVKLQWITKQSFEDLDDAMLYFKRILKNKGRIIHSGTGEIVIQTQ